MLYVIYTWINQQDVNNNVRGSKVSDAMAALPPRAEISVPQNEMFDDKCHFFVDKLSEMSLISDMIAWVVQRILFAVACGFTCGWQFVFLERDISQDKAAQLPHEWFNVMGLNF